MKTILSKKMSCSQYALVLIYLASVLLSACQPKAPSFENNPLPSGVQPEIKQITETPFPSCTPLPAGMVLTFTPVSKTNVEVLMVGFQPGEKVNMTFAYKNAQEEHQMAVVAYPILQDGIRSITVSLDPGQTLGPHPWAVKITHARGVARAVVDLP